MQPFSTNAFKAYDIRGQLGDDLNTTIAYRIGQAYAAVFAPKAVVVGGDMRETSAALKQALAEGLQSAGVNVIDIGMTGTEEVYFATRHLAVDGGIQVTASHNPIDFNGMKLVRRDAVPISSDSGLDSIKSLVATAQFEPAAEPGTLSYCQLRAEFVAHVLGFIDLASLPKDFTMVVNAGNGSAGPVIDAIEAALVAAGATVRLIKIHHQPDATFPNGIPNPLLKANQQSTSDAVIAHKADIGVAWDGDFDRCFFFDAEGAFVDSYYVVGLLAQSFCLQQPGSKIIHDPRLVWNTQDIVRRYDGIAIECKTGHAFIKERMRTEGAHYGGEISGHHYFKDFGYCDSGIIPWLLVLELLGKTEQSLAQLIGAQKHAFPCSGEVNFKVRDCAEVLQTIEQHFANVSPMISRIDGLSMDFGDWRANIRASNTEPLIRLNIESRGDPQLVLTQLEVFKGLIANR